MRAASSSTARARSRKRFQVDQLLAQRGLGDTHSCGGAGRRADRLYAKRDLDAAIARNLAHFEGALWDQVSIAASRRVLARTVQRDY
jgi:hypothetical protein